MTPCEAALHLNSTPVIIVIIIVVVVVIIIIIIIITYIVWELARDIHLHIFIRN